MVEVVNGVETLPTAVDLAQVGIGHHLEELFRQLQEQEKEEVEEEEKRQVEVKGEGEEALRTTTSWMTAWME